MPRLTKRLPKYRLHRPSGQAVVSLGGKTFYLGPHDSTASKREYQRLTGLWIANGRSLPEGPHTGQPTCPQAIGPAAIAAAAGSATPGPAPANLTIAELVRDYLRAVKKDYVRDGQPTGEVDSMKQALAPLARIYGRTAAADFALMDLEAVRDVMIDGGLSRSRINGRVARIKRAFKWAKRRKLVPSAVYEDIRDLEGLRRGKSRAKETKSVRPVAWELVEAVKDHVPAAVWAMIQLQWRTGMRSGEALILRTGDIEMGGAVWLYRPADHKTAHLEHERIVDIGPQAQRVLRPWLRQNLEEYLFEPVESELARNVRRHEERSSPRWPSHDPKARRQRRGRGERRRRPGNVYTPASYRRAIERGIEAAAVADWDAEHGEASHLSRGYRVWLSEGTSTRAATGRSSHERRAWLREHGQQAMYTPGFWEFLKGRSWHPHQLRHSCATRFRKAGGLDAARAVLGHRSVKVTEIYAEADREAVAEIVRKIG